jgi:uncharacterized protein with PQ loop repeat
MFIQTLALTAAVLGVVQSLTLLGQARTLKRIGSAREVSLPFLALAVLCSTAWLLYGALHGDAALVAVNSVGLTGAATTLITAVRLRAADAAGTQPASRVTDQVATARRLPSGRQPAWLSQLGCGRARRSTRLAVTSSTADDQPRSSQLAVAALSS